MKLPVSHKASRLLYFSLAFLDFRNMKALIVASWNTIKTKKNITLFHQQRHCKLQGKTRAEWAGAGCARDALS